MYVGLYMFDDKFDEGGCEVQCVVCEIVIVYDVGVDVDGVVCVFVVLVFDYEVKWLFEVQLQGVDFYYLCFVFEYYLVLCVFGFDVDIVFVYVLFDGYCVVVVLLLLIVLDDFVL